MTFVIAHWQEKFETAETRKLEHLKWCPAPNKLDGLGYRRMVQQRDRCDLFAAWNVLRAIASKTSPKECRGRIERDGRSLTASDLALMSGFPEQIFVRAFTFFSSPEMAWLLEEDDRTASATAADPASNPGESPARPADVPASPAESPAVLNGREGREEKDCGRKAAAFPNGMTDSEFLSVMASDPTYAGIDVPREHGKMAKWCSVNKKVPTRKRFVNWLNRADRPMNGTAPAAVKKRPRELPERFRRWLLEKCTPDRREEVATWKTFADLPVGSGLYEDWLIFRTLD